MNQNSDRALLDQMAGDDVSAFKMIFDKYYTPMIFFAGRFVENRQEVEDMVSEIFMRFWDKRYMAIEIKSLSSYLYRCVKNGCIDIIRKKSRQANELLNADEVDSLVSEQLLDGEEVFTLVIQKVYEAIETLPPQCRTIFKLFYLEGKNTNQIADLLSLSVQSVRNQKNRALGLLRNRIKDPYPLSLLLIHIAFEYVTKNN